MQIKKLWLYNFRNYGNLNVNFSEGINLFIGDNGAGKTNILEAIYYLSTSKSFKNTPDRDIKKWNSDEFALEGQFSTNIGDLKVKFKYNRNKKELYINDLLESRVTGIIGKILIVPFLFDDIYLISGSPAKRRAFIDVTLSMVDLKYFENIRNYMYAIRQKNSLLKNDRMINYNLIKVWNERISEYAGYVIFKRREMIESFNSILKSLRDDVYGNRFLFSIKYKTMLEDDSFNCIEDVRDGVLTLLNKQINKEIALKNCLLGPHRDDFLIYKNDFTVRKFGSIGEGRIASIILKKCQIEFYKKFTGCNPILLIDDIFLELDKDMRRLSKKIIGDNFQILLTTTSKENIPDNLRYHKVFYISNANIVKEDIV